jgi:hypothetical protein
VQTSVGSLVLCSLSTGEIYCTCWRGCCESHSNSHGELVV